MSLNKYAYAGDNPMTFVDPTGHESLSNIWNWMNSGWNGLPAWESVGVIMGVSAVAIVLTCGLAAPEVVGVDAGLIATLGAGLDTAEAGAVIGASAGAIGYATVEVGEGGRPTLSGVLLNAGLGAFGGELSFAFRGLLPFGSTLETRGTFIIGQFLSGAATEFASQAVVSEEGRTPASAYAAVLSGGAFGVLGGASDLGGDYLRAGIGNGLRSFIAGTAPPVGIEFAQNYWDWVFGNPSPETL